MKSMFLFLALAVASVSYAGNYYVDYVSGSDSNPGTKAAPWQHCYGQPGFSASYSHAAGDHFYLKGGVTIPSYIQPAATGTASAPDYYGADPTFYTGSSWSRPIINGQAGSSIGFALYDMNYVTVDNIEFVNFGMTANSDGIITCGPGYGITVENCYFHGWTHSGYSSDTLCCIVGSSYQPYTANLITNCVFDGTGASDSGEAVYHWSGDIKNCIARNMSNGFLPNGGTISGCQIGPINGSFDPNDHENAIEQEGTGAAYWYNNIIHDTTAVTIMVDSSANTAYIYNNLIYNTPPIAIQFQNNQNGAAIKGYVYNNTIVNSSGAVALRSICSSCTVVAENNFSINDGGFATGFTSQTVADNLEETTAQATAAGYTAANNWQPTSASAPTVGAGVNLSSVFTTDLVGNPRPSSGAWDIGAYQYVQGGTASIAVSPASQSCGAIAVGGNASVTFTVKNSGSGTLSGTASVAAPFGVTSGASYSLAAGQSQTVTVQYSPTAAGTNTQSVSFTGGGGASATVTGSATSGAAIAVSPASLSFGSTAVGTSSTQNLTVRNSGGAGTVSGSASVSAPFSITSGGSYSLGAGQSQTVTVQYSPTAAGTNTQTVTFTGAAGTTATVTGSASSPPVANADSYSVAQGTPLMVAAPGVLANDTGGSAALVAALVTSTANGSLTLNSNGSFTYTPNAGFAGADSFTYTASDGQTISAPATATISVAPSVPLFTDGFTTGTLSPWISESGTWTVANNILSGTCLVNGYGYAYMNTNWTNFSVQAQINFPSGAFGGGIGGRLNTTNGAHYGVWVYPENSSGGSSVMKLIKFTGWTSWSGTPMATATLTSGVGTTWHTLLLSFQGATITVSYDGVQQISVTDNNFGSVAPLASGGICAEMSAYPAAYTMSLDNVSVSVTGTLPAPPSALHVLSSSP